MKTKYFLGLATMVLAVASCTNDEIVGSADNKADIQEISFESYANATRADVTATTLKTNGNAFGVKGYVTEAAAFGGTTHTAGAACMYDNTKIVYDGSATSWKYDDATKTAFWPNVNVAFYAYYPYAESVTAEAPTTGTSYVATLPTNNTDAVVTFDVKGDVDALYAKKDQTKSEGATVTIPFQHVYAKINKINLKTTLDMNVTVSNVEVCKVAHTGRVSITKEGKMTYPAGTGSRILDLSSSTVTIVKNDASGKDLVGADNGWYVFPISNDKIWKKTQATDVAKDNVSIKLTAVIKAGNTTIHDGDIYIPICNSESSLAIEAGKRYTFNIDLKNGIGFDKDGNDLLTPIMFDTTVTDWSNGNDVTVNITI